MIYPSPNGFTKGIHSWSVKYIKNNGNTECISSTQSIGVIKAMKKKWITNGFHGSWPDQGFGSEISYYKGYGEKWRPGSTMRILLNLDCGIVEYFCDEKKLKEDKLGKSSLSFYFALCINSCDKYGVFSSVDYY